MSHSMIFRVTLLLIAYCSPSPRTVMYTVNATNCPRFLRSSPLLVRSCALLRVGVNLRKFYSSTSTGCSSICWCWYFAYPPTLTIHRFSVIFDSFTTNRTELREKITSLALRYLTRLQTPWNDTFFPSLFCYLLTDCENQASVVVVPHHFQWPLGFTSPHSAWHILDCPLFSSVLFQLFQNSGKTAKRWFFSPPAPNPNHPHPRIFQDPFPFFSSSRWLGNDGDKNWFSTPTKQENFFFTHAPTFCTAEQLEVFFDCTELQLHCTPPPHGPGTENFDCPLYGSR